MTTPDIETTQDAAEELKTQRVSLYRLRQMKTARMWRLTCAQIDFNANQTPETTQALALARAGILALRQRIADVVSALPAQYTGDPDDPESTP